MSFLNLLGDDESDNASGAKGKFLEIAGPLQIYGNNVTNDAVQSEPLATVGTTVI